VCVCVFGRNLGQDSEYCSNESERDIGSCAADSSVRVNISTGCAEGAYQCEKEGVAFGVL
jgi:hypothetical protein